MSSGWGGVLAQESIYWWEVNVYYVIMAFFPSFLTFYDCMNIRGRPRGGEGRGRRGGEGMGGEGRGGEGRGL